MKHALERVTLDLIEEMYPLFCDHYSEIAHFKDIELKPDFDKYVAFQDAGIIRVYTIRLDDGPLVGYGVYFVQKNMHYKDSTQAVQDILFLKKEHRGVGAKFIEWCDRQLSSEGVEVVYHHVKKNHNFGPLLARMGYELIDYVYGKKL